MAQHLKFLYNQLFWFYGHYNGDCDHIIKMSDFPKIVILADFHLIFTKADSDFLSLAAHFTDSWKTLDNQSCSSWSWQNVEKSWLS